MTTALIKPKEFVPFSKFVLPDSNHYITHSPTMLLLHYQPTIFFQPHSNPILSNFNSVQPHSNPIPTYIHFISTLFYPHFIIKLCAITNYKFIHSLIYLFIHSFIHPSIHSFIHPFIHSFIHSFIHPFTHSLTHAFIHSFIHSFKPPPRFRKTRSI